MQESIADIICDLSSSPAQSYHLKPSCREAVEELYECTDESAALNVENWYPPNLAPLISEYSLKEKEDIFLSPAVNECIKEKAHNWRNEYQVVIDSDAYNNLINSPNVSNYLKFTSQFKELGSNYSWLKAFNRNWYGDLRDLEVDSKIVSVRLKTEGPNCKSLVNRPGSYSTTKVEYKSDDFQELLPPQIYNLLYLENIDSVSLKRQTVYFLCNSSEQKINELFSHQINQLIDSLKRFEAIFKNFSYSNYEQFKKYFDAFKPADKMPLDECHETRKREIISEILKSTEYLKARGDANQLYNKLKLEFGKLLNQNWSLSIEHEDNALNRIIGSITETPLSAKSASELKTSLKDYDNLTIVSDGSLRTLNATQHSYQKYVSITLSSILYGAQNPEFLNFVLAHEIGHMYAHSEGDWSVLSSRTRRSIHSKFGSCISPGKNPNKVTEDISDSLSAVLLANSRFEFTKDSLTRLSKSMCHLTKNRSYTSEHGHSIGLDRLYNFVRHHPQAQEVLGCQLQDSVCTIQFSED